MRTVRTLILSTNKSEINRDRFVFEKRGEPCGSPFSSASPLRLLPIDGAVRSAPLHEFRQTIQMLIDVETAYVICRIQGLKVFGQSTRGRGRFRDVESGGELHDGEALAWKIVFEYHKGSPRNTPADYVC